MSYAVGAIIGILMLLILILALWKSNAFSKMRIFNNKLEDELKQNKQITCL